MEAFSFSTKPTALKAVRAGVEAGPGRRAPARAEGLYRDCLISLEFAACTGRALFLYR